MIKKKQHYKEDRSSMKQINNIATMNSLKAQNDCSAVNESNIAVLSRGRQLNSKNVVIEKKNAGSSTLGEKTVFVQSKSNFLLIF